MTIKLNNIDINNWLDYINVKFADKSLYNISSDNIGYLIKSKTNNTTIWFNLNHDGMQLNECQYYNTDCKGWSGETAGANDKWGVFNQKNVDTLNDVLQTPIKNGWVSVDYYLGDSFYKSKTYYDKDKKSNPFVHVDSRLGCLSALLFPLFWLLGKLIDIGLIGHKKEITIDGINNAH